MNKKIFSIVVAVLAVSMMLTPLAVAKPGALKKNDKFLPFQLIISGETLDDPETTRFTPPGTFPPDSKTIHVRDDGWIPGDTLTLTVGGVTYPDADPLVTLVYSATYDAEVVFKEGFASVTVRVKDTVTISYEGEVLGTLELKVTARGGSTGYTGTIVGYGTGAFEGVKISAIDSVYPDPAELPDIVLIYARIGTIQGWPGIPTP